MCIRDRDFLSDDPALVAQSPIFGGASKFIIESVTTDDAAMNPSALEKEQIARIVASVSQEERKLAAMLVKPNSGQLAKSLEPLLGQRYSNLVFGIGAFSMGFSTFIVLMMINAFAVSELFGMPRSMGVKMLGACLLYTSPSPRDATLSRMPSSA